MVRRIVHVDMDAFYASVEQRDRPELKGLPVIVGGAKRGVVSAASYEARTFGVRSAMPMFEAQRLCPRGVFLPVRMERYREVSRSIMEIFHRITPLVEQVSIDEAYLDITGTESLHGAPEALSRNIKSAITERTGLTCSVGIAPNKFLAKIASDLKKPDGLTIVEESEVAEFMRRLPVHKIPGVGEKTHEKLKSFGVSMACDVLKFPLSFWTRRLGRYGARLYDYALGIDPSPVVPEADIKSCSAEDTLPEDTLDLLELERRLLDQAESVGKSLRSEGYRGKTITLKIKFSDFTSITRSRSLTESTDCTQRIFVTALQLLRELTLPRKVRLIGVGVSNLDRGVLHQLRLFEDSRLYKEEDLDRTMDSIHDKFGSGILKRGRSFP